MPASIAKCLWIYRMVRQRGQVNGCRLKLFAHGDRCPALRLWPFRLSAFACPLRCAATADKVGRFALSESTSVTYYKNLLQYVPTPQNTFRRAEPDNSDNPRTENRNENRHLSAVGNATCPLPKGIGWDTHQSATRKGRTGEGITNPIQTSNQHVIYQNKTQSIVYRIGVPINDYFMYPGARVNFLVSNLSKTTIPKATITNTHSDRT